ncbi:hypothetical protein IPJ91_02085 [bacterium]|nr:MAG: hypothetical protein IPJ91_02085 [bacterium]
MLNKISHKLSFISSHKFINTITVSLVLFNLLFPLVGLPSVNAGNISPNGLISLTNQARSNAGLATLSYNSALTNAACAKADDMFAKDYWAHFGPNGETPWQFIRGAGYNYLYAGENLGKGFSSDSALFNAWMGSSSHKANIMKPEFRDIGICAKDGILLGEETTLVVQMFGALPGSQTTVTSATVSSQVTSANAVVVTQPQPLSQNTSKTNVTTKSTASIAPVIVKDTTPPDKPRINSPIPGTYTNNENIPIIGTAEALSKVQVYQDERKLGESIAENGTWIYDLHEEFVEGVVNISADAIDKAGNLSEKSDIVSFSLDKTIPFVELAKLEVFAKDGCESCSIYSIRVPVGDNMKLEKIAATLNNDPLGELLDNNFQFSYDLENGFDVEIKLSDAAGNQNTVVLENSVLKSKILEYEKKMLNMINSIELEDETNITGILSSIGLDLRDLIMRVQDITFQNRVNLLVGMFLVVIFLLDGTIVYSGGLKTGRSKSGVHFTKLFLVLIVITFSGFGGSILTGL